MIVPHISSVDNTATKYETKYIHTHRALEN